MTTRPGQAQFDAQQRLYFEAPDVPRFRWQTRHPFVAERERAVLPRPALGAGGRFLEVGCGEGANLYQLTREDGGARTTWVGVDLFFAKVRHAAREVPGVRGVCAKGQQLPFPSGAFQRVFSRDVFHHVLDKPVLMAELRRVCAPGGTIIMVEANGRNPIVWLFGLARRAERDVMAMRPEVMLHLAGPDAGDVRLELLEPFPFYRILFHYQYGLPRLARFAWCRRAVAALEGWAGRILPRDRWAYIRTTVRVPASRLGA